MRKVLLSAVALTGLAVASIAGSAPATAQPYGYAPRGVMHPVQYGDWRWRERERRREAWLRHQRHEEWRARHGQYGRRGF